MHFGALPYKTKQFFVVLIKLSLVVGAFYFIYQKITSNNSLSYDAFFEFLHKNNVFSTKNIGFLLILTGFNWFFEILKWKVLVSSIKQISIQEASKQTLGALTASLFTPNRIGEYGAKVLYFLPPFRKRIVILNLLSNITQMSITVMLGVVGLTFFMLHYEIDISYKKTLRFFTLVILIALIIGFGAKQQKLKIKGQPFSKVIMFFKTFPKNTFFKAVLLSFLRYAIFSFQFYWLLFIFGVEMHYLQAMIVISSMYLLASVIPTISLFDVVIKGSIAIYLFNIVGVNELTVLSIVTLMWLLNFALPSVFGSYYVLNFKLPESE